MARKKHRRAWGEGSVAETPNGKHKAVVTVGTDPITKKQLRESRTFDTKQEAVAWKALRLAARGKGDAGRAWTVAAWMEHWLAAKKRDWEYGTWFRYSRLSVKYVVPHLGTARIADLTRLAVDRWRLALDEASVPPGQVHYATLVLRLGLAGAVEADVLARNPVGRHRKPKAKQAIICPLTADQVRKLLEVAAGTPYEAYWFLAIDTGGRPRELLALSWTDVDLDAGTAHIHRSLEERIDGSIHFKAPKTAKGDRVVMIAPDTVAALARHRDRLTAGGRRQKPGRYEPRGLVFPSMMGGPATPTPLTRLYNRHWKRLKKSAGLPEGTRMYDLRHTSATLLVQAGESLRVVADRLGHEDPALTLRFYVRYMPSAQATARDRIQTIFRGLAPG